MDRLISANEVGADPDHPGGSTADFHEFARRLSEDWPATMTTLSTHDTKRQEDVRARLATLAESPEDWARQVTSWHQRAAALPGPAARPADGVPACGRRSSAPGRSTTSRLTEYLRKAMREAKLTTSWTEPEPQYETAATSFARRALADSEIAAAIAAFLVAIGPDAAANSLGAKLIQLTMPGVPDVYQGCELTGLSLVDPDNRRPVDYDHRTACCRRCRRPALTVGPRDAAGQAMARHSQAARNLACAAAPPRQPGWFAGGYQPLAASGAAAAHVIAFSRGARAITLATRLPAGLRRLGGWQDTTLTVPAGRWRDVLTGAEHTAPEGGADAARLAALADLTGDLPVALLAPDRAQRAERP